MHRAEQRLRRCSPRSLSDSFQYWFGIVKTGTVNFTVQHTFDDVFSPTFGPIHGSVVKPRFNPPPQLTLTETTHIHVVEFVWFRTLVQALAS